MVPLNDLRIRTLTDIIPGILNMERETQEMLGVVIEDIPDSRRDIYASQPFGGHEAHEGLIPFRERETGGTSR